MNLAASDLQFNGDLDNRPIEIAQLCVLYQLECCCILWHMSYVKLQRALANRPYLTMPYLLVSIKAITGRSRSVGIYFIRKNVQTGESNSGKVDIILSADSFGSFSHVDSSSARIRPSWFGPRSTSPSAADSTSTGLFGTDI
jgi:hypothetical protein